MTTPRITQSERTGVQRTESYCYCPDLDTCQHLYKKEKIIARKRADKFATKSSFRYKVLKRSKARFSNKWGTISFGRDHPRWNKGE